jgi:hypothetical protein
LSIAFSLLLACAVLAAGLAIHDGLAARSLLEALAAFAIGFAGLSVRAIDVNLAARSTLYLRAAAAIPAIWMVIQSLPTPTGAHSIWAYANEALGWKSWGYISIDPGRTILALIFYLVCVTLILVGIFAARDRHRAGIILSVLTAITATTSLGLLLAKFGFVAPVSNASEALGGISALGFLLSLAMIVRLTERYQMEVPNSVGPASHIRMTSIASAVALLVSTGGLISVAATAPNVALATMFAVVAFGSVQLVRRVGLPGWAVGMLVATLVIAAAMVALWRYDATKAVSPILNFVSASSPEAISITQRLLSDVRWLGTGAGTFSVALPIYQDLGGSLTAPPSTISLLAIEMGMPMTFLVIAIAAWLATLLFQAALRRGRDSFYPAVAAAAILALLGEAFCDASLANSGVAVIAAVVIGLGLAQRVSGRDIL